MQCSNKLVKIYCQESSYANKNLFSQFSDHFTKCALVAKRGATTALKQKYGQHMYQIDYLLFVLIISISIFTSLYRLILENCQMC